MAGGIPERLTQPSGTAGTDLTGTRALITGGTSGLGLAMAEALAEAGATVGLTGRDAARAGVVAARLPEATGLALDVRDEAAVARVVERAWSMTGQPGHGEHPAARRRDRDEHATRRAPAPGLSALDPAVMGPPIAWLASPAAGGVHDERIVATEFGAWLRERSAREGG